jgi:hypothetical protein
MADGTKQPDASRKDSSIIIHRAPWGSIAAVAFPAEEVAPSRPNHPRMRTPLLHSLPAKNCLRSSQVYLIFSS